MNSTLPGWVVGLATVAVLAAMMVGILFVASTDWPDLAKAPALLGLVVGGLGIAFRITRLTARPGNL
jgi:uncharacterized membrane protein